MKKLSKTLALLLAVIMVLGLCACGVSEETAAKLEAIETSLADIEETVSGMTSGQTASAPAESADDETAAPAQGSVIDELTIGAYSNYAVSGLDATFVNTSNCAYMLFNLCFDQMFYVDPETNEMVSDIFESWEYSEDNLRLTLQLKDGIYFSNGTQMTGDDILYTISQWQQTRKKTYYTCINLDESSVSEDGLTIELVYNFEYGPGIKKLQLWVISKDFYEGLGDLSTVDWFDKANVCGSGPYALTDYVQDTSAVVELRDDYWNDASNYSVKKFVINRYTDQTTMFIDFENQIIDVAVNLASSDATRLNDGEVEFGALGLIESNAVTMICLNESNEYFQDPVVREAICHAIDTETVARQVLGIYGTAAQSTLSVNMPAFQEGCAYTYDPEYAKQLLTDAGYEEGEITVHYVCSSDSEQAALAEFFQGYLNNIGITVEIETVDEATMKQMLAAGESDIQRQTATEGTPELEPYECYSAFPVGGTFPAVVISDENINELLNGAYQTGDEQTRIDLYKQAQTAIYESYWVVPMYEWKAGYAYNTELIDSVPLVSSVRPDFRFITTK